MEQSAGGFTLYTTVDIYYSKIMQITKTSRNPAVRFVTCLLTGEIWSQPGQSNYVRRNSVPPPFSTGDCQKPPAKICRNAGFVICKGQGPLAICRQEGGRPNSPLTRDHHHHVSVATKSGVEPY